MTPFKAPSVSLPRDLYWRLERRAEAAGFPGNVQAFVVILLQEFINRVPHPSDARPSPE